MGMIVILLSVGYGIFHHYYSKLNITVDDIPDDTYYEVSDADLNLNLDFSSISASDLEALNLMMNNDFSDEPLFDSKNVTNILLIGTDGRVKGNKRTRSDAMILVSINKETKKIVMTSFMRDIYVEIPKGEDYHNRMNVAFAIGGPNLLFNTIKKNFGITVDKYVHIDFYNFMEIVDAVGGVDMDVTNDELKIMNHKYIYELNVALKQPLDKDFIWETQTGREHFNGKQALAYTRVRYVGNGDFERTERQRKVLLQIMEKTKKMSITELNKLADVTLPLIATNLSQGEVMGLLVNSPTYLTYEVETFRVPDEGTYRYEQAGDAEVLSVNFRMNRNRWHKLVYGE